MNNIVVFPLVGEEMLLECNDFYLIILMFRIFVLICYSWITFCFYVQGSLIP